MKIEIIISHYGAFKKLGSNTIISVPAPITIGTVRAALAEKLGDEHKALVEDSALANDTDILPDAFVIDANCALSILPPVCGG
jgi:molybdopterin converting factor small subunit